MKRVLALSLTVVLSAVALSAQLPRRVTIVTQKGDVIEGTLKSATDSEVVIEIAGQALKVPVETIKYLSFVGKLDAAPSVVAHSGKPIDEAIKSLNELRAATRVGMLRAQYSEKLVATLPQVRTFAESREAGWFDVKLAMTNAVLHYQRPMASIESWKDAGWNMGMGGRWVDYVETLRANGDEETHTEKPDDQPISIGSAVTGRLGAGDASMSKMLDASSEGGFNDKWSLELTSPANVTVSMTSEPCRPHLTLTDGSGKRLDADSGPYGGDASIHKSLPAGRYRIWAGSFSSQVGSYKLSVK